VRVVVVVVVVGVPEELGFTLLAINKPLIVINNILIYYLVKIKGFCN
jgi:hypothetical protein